MKQETLAMTLRYKLGLTGTKIGCDRAECGACTVLVDDVPRYSCSTLTHTVRGKKIVTIEGLADTNGTLHPVQQGVVDEQGFQCAFCMPGFVMAAVGFLKTNPSPTRQELPGPAVGATLGENVQATAQGERALASEPLYQGEPILAVAAVDELTAAEAIEKIVVDFEPLPFVVDPIESLRPNGPNARTQGNVWVRPPAPPPAPPAADGRAAPPPPAPAPQIQTLRWPEQAF